MMRCKKVPGLKYNKDEGASLKKKVILHKNWVCKHLKINMNRRQMSENFTFPYRSPAVAGCHITGDLNKRDFEPNAVIPFRLLCTSKHLLQVLTCGQMRLSRVCQFLNGNTSVLREETWHKWIQQTFNRKQGLLLVLEVKEFRWRQMTLQQISAEFI